MCAPERLVVIGAVLQNVACNHTATKSSSHLLALRHEIAAPVLAYFHSTHSWKWDGNVVGSPRERSRSKQLTFRWIGLG